MKLNSEQKRFLLENGYVTPQQLGALALIGWESYFSKRFDWEFAGKDRCGMDKIYLKDKATGDIAYVVGVEFGKGDFDRLLKLKGARK